MKFELPDIPVKSMGARLALCYKI